MNYVQQRVLQTHDKIAHFCLILANQLTDPRLMF